MNEQTQKIVEKAQAKIRKEIVADPAYTILVIQLDDTWEDPRDQTLEKIKANVETALPGIKCLVLPPGIDAKAVPSGGVYQREKLSNYEYEIVAANEQDLIARMKSFHTSPVVDSVKDFNQYSKGF